MVDALRVLISADHAGDAESIVAGLAGAGCSFEHRRVGATAELVAELGEPWDAVLAGPAAELSPDVVLTLTGTGSGAPPIIVVAAPEAESDAARLVRAGASDYVLLDRLDRLGLAVVHAVERRRLLAVSRRTEDQLARTAELLRVTFDASTNALIAVDRAADVIEWNSTAERLLGWTAAEVRGRDLRGLLAGGHELENLLAAGIAGAGSSQQARACTVQHRHGQRIRVELLVTPLGAGEQTPSHLITLTDISERRRMEQLKDSRLGVLRALAGPNAQLALVGVLEQVAGAVGCDRGILWETDGRGSLRFRSSWSAHPAGPTPEPATADDVIQWVHTTGKFSFVDHDDPGAITIAAATGEPARARVAFPLVQGQHIYGVVELSSYELPNIDDHLLLLLSAVGAHTGTFIARKRSEAEFARSLEELRRVESDRRRLMHLLVEAQEDERRAIAADIHDDPLQVMSAIALRLHVLRRRLADPLALQSVGVVEEMVASAISRLRTMMFDLRPPALDRGHLAEPLRDRLEKTRREHGLEFVLTAHEPDRLNTEARVILYRVAQEAIVNIVKHARATRIEVSLEAEGDGCLMRVADNGIGIGREMLDGRPGHMGVRSMRERAELGDGWLKVEAGDEAGTVVSCWVPAGTPRPARNGRAA